MSQPAFLMEIGALIGPQHSILSIRFTIRLDRSERFGLSSVNHEKGRAYAMEMGAWDGLGSVGLGDLDGLAFGEPAGG